MALLKKDDSHTDLKEENERLRQSLEELSILIELSSVISSTMSLNNIMDKVVAKSVKAVNAKQGTIHLLDKESQNDDPFTTFIRKADETTPTSKFRLDVELSGWMMRHMKPLLINDFENNKHFISRRASDFAIKTLLSVPLVCKGELIGVLNLYNKKGNQQFSQEDQKLLSIIASQSAQVIENARLYEQEKQLLKIERELEMARSIQTRLLPKESPRVQGFDIAGASYAARDVGGDYFDFIELDNGNWCIALGDVSGKGIPAALLMSHLQATVRNQALSNDKFSDCVAKTNDFLYRHTEGNKFVTMFGGILDPKRKTFSYVNAGHNFPYHLQRNGKAVSLEVGGLVMGMMPGCLYEQDEIELESGELVVIYSDGVTEAENAIEEMFGTERFTDLLMANKQKTAGEIVTEIYRTVKQFEANAEQDDDITVVVVKAV
ncbi:MAG: PP2C family protein-serine/threonine phosphatase [bacterium]